ncbi:hypothetical protein BV25DRAFT_1529333 [Artomyces pyxidatus]|uniref:Uncharacterized protein n=1 Tax=Artomyces pyxidatus TaxID=48021 RepID=A0ACB8TDC4_9AGAM|nr:hypothetical protein BV25DRAFT_1529333 [Artomyces pyxidatus]
MLSLHDDILVEILKNLEWKDVVVCRQACHKLHSLIGASVLLQYTIELGACGMLDGESGPHSLPVHERLERLKLHLEAWQNLTWTEHSSLTHVSWADSVT